MSKYRVQLKWKIDDVIEDVGSKEEAFDKLIAWMEWNFFTDVCREDIEVVSIEEVE